MNRVLFSFLRPREIEISAETVGNGKIRLLDASQHFLIELLLKRFRGLQNSVGVGVFGFQVGNDFRVFFVAQPSVMVDTAVTRPSMFLRLAAGAPPLG